MMKAFLLGALAALVLLAGPPANAAQLTACATGVTNCANDTTNDVGLANAVNDSLTQTRVFNLWMGQCQNIYSEAATTTGHAQRVAMCQSIAAGNVPKATLVAAIINTTTEPEILTGNTTCPGAQCAGNLVDVDVVTAIGAAMTVSSSSGSPTATASQGSQQLTVSSTTGLVAGAGCTGAGLETGATILIISGSVVTLSLPVTAPLSSTPITCTLLTGLPTRSWP